MIGSLTNVHEDVGSSHRKEGREKRREGGKEGGRREGEGRKTLFTLDFHLGNVNE